LYSKFLWPWPCGFTPCCFGSSRCQFFRRSRMQSLLTYFCYGCSRMFYDHEARASSKTWSYGHKTRIITLKTGQSEHCI
jgi:hypothetical protein